MRQGDHPRLPSILADSGDPSLPSVLAVSPGLPQKRRPRFRACTRENPRKQIKEARPGARRR